MNAWTRVNLLLGALAAVLLALHLWPNAVPMQPALTGLSANEIRQVRVERADQLEILLERQGNGWQLLYPRQAPALERRVEQILAIAQAPVQLSYPAGDGLTRYGLEHPQAVLQLDETRLAFGDRDPTQQLRYVLADAEVRVIDDVYFNLLTLPARHFVGD